MSKEEIRKIVLEGANGKYSHCIIYSDHWDYTYNWRYVKLDEDINKIISNIKAGGSPGMFTIDEIYNYSLDLKEQLNDPKTYHLETLNELVQKEGDSSYLNKAIIYATKMHKGQTRKNGEPYINHPLRVAQNVLKYKHSKNLEILLVSACLHDTLEDTSATYYDLIENFGPQVASIVLELTTDEDMKNLLGKEKYLAIRMKNMSSWSLIIKLCDRLDNVKDLVNTTDESFKNKYLNETIGIIEYLLTNAKLSQTHLNILEEIILTLIKLSIQDTEKIEKLIKIYEIYINLRIVNKENNDLFESLLHNASRKLIL